MNFSILNLIVSLILYFRTIKLIIDLQDINDETIQRLAELINEKIV